MLSFGWSFLIFLYPPQFLEIIILILISIRTIFYTPHSVRSCRPFFSLLGLLHVTQWSLYLSMTCEIEYCSFLWLNIVSLCMCPILMREGSRNCSDRAGTLEQQLEARNARRQFYFQFVYYLPDELLYQQERSTWTPSWTSLTDR